MSELLVPGFGRNVMLCRGRMPRSRGIAAYVRDGYGPFRQHKFECGCCEMLVFRVCGERLNLNVFSLYRNPGLDDRIFDCLLTSMAAVQAEDVCASFLFVGDLNGHHQERLGSTTTNRHGVAGFDTATVSGCDQLVVGPTYVRGGTLDLMMTDVPDLVRVFVVAPMVTRMIPLCRQLFRWLRLFRTCVLVGKFSLNIKLIGIRFVVQCRIYPMVTFGLLTILLRF